MGTPINMVELYLKIWYTGPTLAPIPKDIVDLDLWLIMWYMVDLHLYLYLTKWYSGPTPEVRPSGTEIVAWDYEVEYGVQDLEL